MFHRIRSCLTIGGLVVITACGPSTAPTLAPTQASTSVPGAVSEGTKSRQSSVGDVHIAQFTVHVPRTLRVNERNLYYPVGDIVWRAEPPGDRHAQVTAIFETALHAATPRVEGTRPVRIDVQVTRFHALSEKARYTVGGVHDINFRYRLVDVKTGESLGPPVLVDANLTALGGQAALDAERRGQTQKARIIAHLTQVFVRDVSGA